ncbi:hypothetical protein FHX69_0565 [Prauserella muralis]|nr:hypothetical protein FHX69_0565 [Prauserella muralis]
MCAFGEFPTARWLHAPPAGGLAWTKCGPATGFLAHRCPDRYPCVVLEA